MHTSCILLLQSSSFLSVCTGSAMLQVGALEYCLNILKALLDFWKQTPSEEVSALDCSASVTRNNICLPSSRKGPCCQGNS